MEIISKDITGRFRLIKDDKGNIFIMHERATKKGSPIINLIRGFYKAEPTVLTPRIQQSVDILKQAEQARPVQRPEAVDRAGVPTYHRWLS